MKSFNDPSSEDLGLSIKSMIRGKVAVVGLGNIIRGDDGLGPKLIELLKEKRLDIPLFDCGTVPENYIFPILSTSCDTVILVDAADLGIRPGGAMVFGLDEIANVSFSTHNPSPRLFTDLLKTGKENMNIFVVSVQPKSMELGQPLSEEVLKGLDVLAEAIAGAV
ncbi:MAG TPA: hydrogenase maturation protease [Candidatus Omnitrophota bacterium]|nr:hydrogenase maturation protease [Candidatus Omnitrophota bacterium]